MKSKKHSDSVAVRLGTSAQQSIEACFSTSSTNKAVDSTSVTDSHMDSSEDNDDGRSLVSAHVITDYAITAEVKKAEIIWAIKTVGSYLGIASYFTQKLVDKNRACECYVASFDESLNEVCQQGQMDINSRYFHQGKVLSQYLDSQFLGHATAIDLLQAFKKGTSKLNPYKLLQVSTDGPNVNLKFMQELVNDRKRCDPELPGMLQLATCTLHSIHLAFFTAIKDSGWGLSKLFRALW